MALVVSSGPAWSAAPPPSPSPQTPSPQTPSPTVSELVVIATKAVSELTVTGKPRCLSAGGGGPRADRPKVVDVFPARGAVVRPGLLMVRVTFDQPMTCEGRFDPVPSLPDPCPGATREMLLSYDRRTVRTVCVVEPGTKYGFSLGQDPTAPTFIGLAGLPAAPATVSFSTADGPLVTDVCQAMAQDAVTAADLQRRGKACPPAAGG